MSTRKNRTIGFLVFLCILFSGCEKKQSIGDRFDFSENKNGVSFSCPVSFTKTSGKGLWSTYTWEDQKNGLTIQFKVSWNKDLIYFKPEESLNIYLSTYRLKNTQSSIYLKDAKKFPLSAGIDAMEFQAIDGNKFIWGIYTVANHREYVLKLISLEKNKESVPFQNTIKILKTLKIEILPDHQQYINQLLRHKDFSETSNVIDILNYGQELMSNKEAYITNYPKAIKEFRKALNIMGNLNPKPPEYSRALRLITIAKELQRKACDKHDLLFVQSINLKDYKAALKECQIILQLLSDDHEHPLIQITHDRLNYINRYI